MSVSEIEKSRLIELLKDIENHPEKTCPRFDSDSCSGCKFDDNGKCDMGARKADYLLANGVIVPSCKVGDVVWLIGNMKLYTKEEICSRKVISVQMLRTGELIMHFKDGCFSSDAIGVFVFFTKEEALSKLQASCKQVKGEEI